MRGDGQLNQVLNTTKLINTQNSETWSATCHTVQNKKLIRYMRSEKKTDYVKFQANETRKDI